MSTGSRRGENRGGGKKKSDVSRFYYHLKNRFDKAQSSKTPKAIPKSNVPKVGSSETSTSKDVKASQHGKQESHVKQPSIPDRSLADLYCKICDAHMNSQNMWNSHISGKRHIRHMKMNPKDLERERQQQFINGKIHHKVQQYIENCEEPIIGLQFVVENRQCISGVDPTYHCDLCQSNMTISSLLDHVTSAKHQSNYLKKADSSSFIAIHKMDLTKSAKDNLVYNKICKLAATNGPGKMKIREMKAKSGEPKVKSGEAKIKSDPPSKRRKYEGSPHEEGKCYRRAVCRSEHRKPLESEKKSSHYCMEEEEEQERLSYGKKKATVKQLLPDSNHTNPAEMRHSDGNDFVLPKISKQRPAEQLVFTDEGDCRSDHEGRYGPDPKEFVPTGSLGHWNLACSSQFSNPSSSKEVPMQVASCNVFPMYGLLSNSKELLPSSQEQSLSRVDVPQEALSPEQLIDQVRQSSNSVKWMLLEELSEMPITSIDDMKKIMHITNTLMHQLGEFKLQLVKYDGAHNPASKSPEVLRNIISCSQNSDVQTNKFLVDEAPFHHVDSNSFQTSFKKGGFGVPPTDQGPSHPDPVYSFVEASTSNLYQSIPFLEGVDEGVKSYQQDVHKGPAVQSHHFDSRSDDLVQDLLKNGEIQEILKNYFSH